MDNAAAQGALVEVLTFDGYSAFQPLRDDYSPTHLVTRRNTYEAQCACFAETRRYNAADIVPQMTHLRHGARPSGGDYDQYR